MSATFTIDREFQRTLREYSTIVPNQLDEIINKKALYVTRAALRETPKASKQDIDASLGAIGSKVSVSRKTGKFKRRGTVFRHTEVGAFRIINGRRVKAGKEPLQGRVLERVANRMISARYRAIGSLKAGWISAIISLSRAAKEFTRLDKLPRVRHRGRVMVARPGWNPVAEMEYRVLVGGKIDPRAVVALQVGFRREEISMRRFIERKLAPGMQRISAK